MGDYSRKLDRFTDVSGSTVLAAGDNLSVTPRDLVAAVSGETIYVQKILININTVAAQSLTFRDGAGTPIVIGTIAASAPINPPILMDFGPDGRALTESEEFRLANSAAGVAADITWTAYRKRTATTAS